MPTISFHGWLEILIAGVIWMSAMLVLWSSWSSYRYSQKENFARMNKDRNRFLNAAIVIALICGSLGVLGPIFTIILENNANAILGRGDSAAVSSTQETKPEGLFGKSDEEQRSFTEFGAVGDWLGGSSVPFLTLATLLIALATFREQRKELIRVREESENQNRTLNLQRFENTYFLLQSEVQKRHDAHEVYEARYDPILPSESFNTYEEFFNTMKYYGSDLTYEPDDRNPIQDPVDFKRAVRYRQILQGIFFAEENKDLRLEHVRRLKRTIEKIFELFTIHQLPESTRKFYAELLKIQLSRSSILALLYLSLEDFHRSDGEYPHSVIRNFSEYDFYRPAMLQSKKYLFESSPDDEDHLFFLFLTSLNDNERIDFHDKSMHLVSKKQAEERSEE